MISLSFSSAILLYVSLLLGILFLLWGGLFWKKWHFTLPAATHPVLCEFCHFQYLAPTKGNTSRCPCCNCLNSNQSLT